MVTVGLFYNFTYVKMKGPNKQIETETEVQNWHEHYEQQTLPHL